MKYKKLLLVEDGSVDLRALKRALKGSEIYIVVYRNGSAIPQILDIDTQENFGQVQAIGFEVPGNSEKSDE